MGHCSQPKPSIAVVIIVGPLAGESPHLVGPQVRWVLRHTQHFPPTHDNNAVRTWNSLAGYKGQGTGAVRIHGQRSGECDVREKNGVLNSDIETTGGVAKSVDTKD